MRVDGIKGTILGQTGGTPRDAALAPVEQDGDSRALVVVAPSTVQKAPANYRQSQFLAHLIATKDHLPQTRERRRAEPGVAIAAYRAVAAMTGHH